MLLSALVCELLPRTSPRRNFRCQRTATRSGASCVFAPVVETLIMGAVLLVLTAFLSARRSRSPSARSAGASRIRCSRRPGALVIWWPFLIFSILFVTWRQRSLALAFLVPMAVHALQNLLPALLIAAGVEA